MAYVTLTTTPDYQVPKTTFKADLKRAYDLENKLKQWFLENYKCTVETFQGIGSFTNYDLKVTFDDGEVITFEVKEDKMVSRTGNVAVEVGRRVQGQMIDTCLSISKADVYVYFFEDAFHFIPAESLRQFIKDKKFVFATWGGDAKKAVCVLFSKKFFLQHSISINV